MQMNDNVVRRDPIYCKSKKIDCESNNMLCYDMHKDREVKFVAIGDVDKSDQMKQHRNDAIPAILVQNFDQKSYDLSVDGDSGLKETPKFPRCAKEKRELTIPDLKVKERLMKPPRGKRHQYVATTPLRQRAVLDIKQMPAYIYLEQKVRQMKMTDKRIIDIDDFLNSDIQVADVSMITCLDDVDENADGDRVDVKEGSCKININEVMTLIKLLKLDELEMKAVEGEKYTSSSKNLNIEKSTRTEAKNNLQASEGPSHFSSKIPISSRTYNTRMFWEGVYDCYKANNHLGKNNVKKNYKEVGKEVLLQKSNQEEAVGVSKNSFHEGPYLDLSDPRLKDFLKSSTKIFYTSRSAINLTNMLPNSVCKSKDDYARTKSESNLSHYRREE